MLILISTLCACYWCFRSVFLW